MNEPAATADPVGFDLAEHARAALTVVPPAAPVGTIDRAKSLLNEACQADLAKIDQMIAELGALKGFVIGANERFTQTARKAQELTGKTDHVCKVFGEAMQVLKEEYEAAGRQE